MSSQFKHMRMSVFPGPVNTIVNATWMEPLTSVNAQRPGKEEPAAILKGLPPRKGNVSRRKERTSRHFTLMSLWNLVLRSVEKAQAVNRWSMDLVIAAVVDL